VVVVAAVAAVAAPATPATLFLVLLIALTGKPVSKSPTRLTNVSRAVSRICGFVGKRVDSVVYLLSVENHNAFFFYDGSRWIER